MSIALPSFHTLPKKTKTYTKSYKISKFVLASFRKVQIVHIYALLCIVLHFLLLFGKNDHFPKKIGPYNFILEKVHNLHKYWTFFPKKVYVKNSQILHYIFMHIIMLIILIFWTISDIPWTNSTCN